MNVFQNLIPAPHVLSTSKIAQIGELAYLLGGFELEQLARCGVYPTLKTCRNTVYSRSHGTTPLFQCCSIANTNRVFYRLTPKTRAQIDAQLRIYAEEKVVLLPIPTRMHEVLRCNLLWSLLYGTKEPFAISVSRAYFPGSQSPTDYGACRPADSAGVLVPDAVLSFSKRTVYCEVDRFTERAALREKIARYLSLFYGFAPAIRSQQTLLLACFDSGAETPLAGSFGRFVSTENERERERLLNGSLVITQRVRSYLADSLDAPAVSPLAFAGVQFFLTPGVPLQTPSQWQRLLFAQTRQSLLLVEAEQPYRAVVSAQTVTFPNTYTLASKRSCVVLLENLSEDLFAWYRLFAFLSDAAFANANRPLVVVHITALDQARELLTQLAKEKLAHGGILARRFERGFTKGMFPSFSDASGGLVFEQCGRLFWYDEVADRCYPY